MTPEIRSDHECSHRTARNPDSCCRSRCLRLHRSGAVPITLAAGAPFGRAAWGGTNPGQLPVGLRIGSTVATGVWILAAVLVAGRAGLLTTPFSPSFLQRGTWALVVITLIGGVMNFASPSPWERFMWAPITLALAGLCYLVARDSTAL